MKKFTLGIIAVSIFAGCKSQNELAGDSSLREIAEANVSKTFGSVEELRDSSFSKVYEFLLEPEKSAEVAASLNTVALATGTADRKRANSQIAAGMSGTWGQVIMKGSGSSWKEEMVFSKDGGTQWGVSAPRSFDAATHIEDNYYTASLYAGVRAFADEQRSKDLKISGSFSVVSFSGELADTMRKENEALAMKFSIVNPSGMATDYRIFFAKDGRILALDSNADVDWNGQKVKGHFSEMQYSYGAISQESSPAPSSKPVTESMD